MLVNKNSSNADLEKDPQVAKAIAEGKIILIDKQPTSNPGYVTMFFVGQCETKSESSNLSAFERQGLGFSDTSKFLMRSTANYSAEMADKTPLGTTFDACLQIVDSNKPSWDTHAPRQNKSGEIYLDANGDKIYRNAKPMFKEEFEAVGHKITKHVSVLKSNPTISASELITAAAGSGF